MQFMYYDLRILYDGINVYKFLRCNLSTTFARDINCFFRDFCLLSFNVLF